MGKEERETGTKSNEENKEDVIKKDENYLVKAQETKAGARLRSYKRVTRKKAPAWDELKQGGIKRMLNWAKKKEYLDDVLTTIHVKETAHHHGQARGIHFLHVDL
jgi:hypothetical protein